MALADIPTGGHSRRLDSWKEIAEYLGRDVRTATRWEALGMPLHRVPGGRGSSVFAFTTEIDAWMAGRASDADQPVAAPPALPPQDPPPAQSRRRVVVAGLSVVGAVAVAGVAAFTWATPSTPASLGVTATSSAITVTHGADAPRGIHQFAPSLGAVLVSRTPARVEDLDADGMPDIVAAVSYYEHTGDRSIHHGELLHLSPSGDVRWKFAFNDVLRIGDGSVAGPWALADWQAGPAGRTPAIVVAAHDFAWWASMVAIIDNAGTRHSTFFNPGWIESVLWLDNDRVAAGGFNNPRNEAMVAILDARDVSGQAPGTAGSPFSCVSCSAAAPLFYATLPRSELNLVTASRFNRAQISVLDDRIIVTTSEMQDRGTATAMYEFHRDLTLLRARYSDPYWVAHRKLELEGRLTHARETCPERDGPAAIHVWSGSAWVRTPVSH